MHDTFTEVTHMIVLGIEIAGVVTIVVGILLAVAYGLFQYAKDRNLEHAYHRVRHGIGRALMLGLDLLIASEIMLSILADSLDNVMALGLTIVIRTFLSLTLTVEIEGELPWRRGSPLLGEEESG